MAEIASKKALYRDAVRWGLLLAGIGVVGVRVPQLRMYYQQWHSLSGIDPSAANAYKTFFEFDAGIAAFIVALAVALFYILRPRAEQQR